MKLFTIFICTYNAQRTPDGILLIQRCLDSVLKYTLRDKVNIFVGANAIDEEEGKGKWDAPRLYLEDKLEKGDIDLLIISKENIGKEGIYTLLMRRVETEYVIFIDDDTHFHGDILTEIEEEIAYDKEGLVAEWGRIAGFVPIGKITEQSIYGTSLGANDIRRQTWFKGKPLFGVPACSGGFVVCRTEALRSVGYPACTDNFAIFAEDTILGMALYQQGWTLRNLPLAWDIDKIGFGDERGIGSRTERGKPRKIWNGEMQGIEVLIKHPELNLVE